MNLPTKLLLLAFGLLVAACDGDDPTLAQGVFGPLGTVRPNATEAERATFARGESVALRRFTPQDGLGPNFNVTFCGACRPSGAFPARRLHGTMVERPPLKTPLRPTTGRRVPRVSRSKR